MVNSEIRYVILLSSVDELKINSEEQKKTQRQFKLPRQMVQFIVKHIKYSGIKLKIKNNIF